MPKFLSNLTITSYICYLNHTMATILVTVSMSGNTVDVAFDMEDFRRSQILIPENLLNDSECQQSYTTPKWFEYIASLEVICGNLEDSF